MPVQTLTLPLAQPTPLRPSQRDLVLPAGDGWRLALRLVGEDVPAGADPPPLRLSVFRPGPAPDAIWRGWAVPQPGDTPGGTVFVPGEVTATWHGRLGFCVQAELDGGTATLARGTLLVLPGFPLPPLLDALQDDAGAPILTETLQTIQVRHAPTH